MRIPKVIDIKFLNEEATKIKSLVKKLKGITDLGEDAFKTNPMYPDRAKYYLIILKEELEKVACHLLQVFYQETVKDNCLEKLAKEEIFDAKLSRALLDIDNMYKQLIKESMVSTPENFYPILKEVVDVLNERFLPELAKVVKSLKEKQPELKVPVNLNKLKHHIFVINSNLKKLETFLKYPKEEFLKSNRFIDRSKYYIVSALDSANWICRHFLRAVKEKPQKDCFAALKEKGLLDEESYNVLSFFAKERGKLVNPQEELEPTELYENLVKAPTAFKKFYKSVLEAVLNDKK